LNYVFLKIWFVPRCKHCSRLSRSANAVQGETEVWVCSVVSPAPDRGGLLIPHLDAVSPGKSPGFHYGSVVGPMAGLDKYGEDKISYPIGIRTSALSELLY